MMLLDERLKYRKSSRFSGKSYISYKIQVT